MPTMEKDHQTVMYNCNFRILFYVLCVKNNILDPLAFWNVKFRKQSFYLNLTVNTVSDC